MLLLCRGIGTPYNAGTLGLMFDFYRFICSPNVPIWGISYELKKEKRPLGSSR